MVEEAAQEVFLKTYTQLASYEGRGSFEGWLTRIATTTCLNLLRSAKSRPESSAVELTEDQNEWFETKLTGDVHQSGASVESRLIAADLAEKVLETLPPDDRIVLILIDGNEISVKEAADVTGWSESKVKVKAMRARRRMRQAVDKLLETRKSGKSAGRT